SIYSNVAADELMFFWSIRQSTRPYLHSFLHDALPILQGASKPVSSLSTTIRISGSSPFLNCAMIFSSYSSSEPNSASICLLNSRSEVHTSELKSQSNIVSRLLITNKLASPCGHTTHTL